MMNPFVNLPIFLALTAGFSQADQRALALKITVYSLIMCGVILVAGNAIIGFFGITIDQFRLAGGAVLGHIAWSMLNGAGIAAHQGSTQEQAQMNELSGLAFYPMTFPMVVGPGTIATIIIYAGHSKGSVDLAMIAGIVGLMLLLLFLVLFFAAQIGKMLSETMRVITTRLMGMILLAISVEMIVAGLTALLPGLARAGG
ncbi:MAG: MarC family protein [Sphingobium sp.]